MSQIKKITVSGIRGILTPLEINFVKGNSARSMVIYGSNGTGKSSITDAWEWLHKEKIEHLGREGAGRSAYPHKDAENGDSFIEINFANGDLDRARLEFNHDRVTQPIVEGDVEAFRQLVPHPCHVRFSDLKDFVYKTKTEKYEALARLMGFTSQMKLQQGLDRVLRQLQDKVENYEEKIQESQQQLTNLLRVDNYEEESLLEKFNELLDRNDLENCDEFNSLSSYKEQFREKVENDPRAQELSDLRSLEQVLNQVEPPENIWDEVERSLTQISTFLDMQMTSLGG